jgi:signal peptidase I
MNPSSFDNGDPFVAAPAATGYADAGRPVPGASGRAGRHAGAGTVPRATTVQLPQDLDYRLRGLRTVPTDDAPASPPRTDRQPHRRGSVLTKVFAFLAVVALAIVLLQAFVIQPFAVPGNAMSPTLGAGDRILVVKPALLAGPIRSGEIIVARPPSSLACTVVGGHAGDLVLRVIALPGETIWSVGSTVYIDGRPLAERGWYNPRSGQVGSTPIRSTTLAPGQYFAMADNRSNACDSRVFGPISKSAVIGKGIAIVGHHGHVSLGTL